MKGFCVDLTLERRMSRIFDYTSNEILIICTIIYNVYNIYAFDSLKYMNTSSITLQN